MPNYARGRCKTAILGMMTLLATMSIVLLGLLGDLDLGSLLEFQFYLMLIWIVLPYLVFGLLAWFFSERSAGHCWILAMGSVVILALWVFSLIVVISDWENEVLGLMFLLGIKGYQFIVIAIIYIALFIYQKYLLSQRS